MRFLPVAAEVSQPLHRSAYMKYAVTERYIAPFQRTYFAYAQSGQQCKQRSEAAQIVFCLGCEIVGQSALLLARQHAHLVPLLLRIDNICSTEARYPYLDIAQYRAQLPEDITHRFCRKPVAMQQVVCKLLRQRRGQLRPPIPAEPRFDVLLRYPGIFDIGRFLDPAALQSQPLVAVIGHQAFFDRCAAAALRQRSYRAAQLFLCAAIGPAVTIAVARRTVRRAAFYIPRLPPSVLSLIDNFSFSAHKSTSFLSIRQTAAASAPNPAELTGQYINDAVTTETAAKN